MAEGLREVVRKLRSIPDAVLEGVTVQIAKEADKIVAEMNALKPLPEIEIGWTFGDAPEGAITIGRVGNREFGRIVATIFAIAETTDEGIFPAIARWWEFGVGERFTREGAARGAIPAQPYFFPVIRSNSRRVRGNISRAVTRAMRDA